MDCSSGGWQRGWQRGCSVADVAQAERHELANKPTLEDWALRDARYTSPHLTGSDEPFEIHRVTYRELDKTHILRTLERLRLRAKTWQKIRIIERPEKGRGDQ